MDAVLIKFHGWIWSVDGHTNSTILAPVDDKNKDNNRDNERCIYIDIWIDNKVKRLMD